MNLTNTNTPRLPDASVLEPGMEMIGCAQVFPFPVSLDCGDLFHMVLRTKLEASNIGAGHWMGVCRPHFFMFGCDVSDRNRGLAAMREVLEDKGMITGFAQIAYWDKAELCWRSVLGGPEPFDRFFTEEELRAARWEALQRTAAWLSAIDKLANGGRV